MSVLAFFLLNRPATPEIDPYGPTLSRHDALPICAAKQRMCATQPARFGAGVRRRGQPGDRDPTLVLQPQALAPGGAVRQEQPRRGAGGGQRRSEEHTSELQSLMRISYAVFCLKKKITHNTAHQTHTSNRQV